MTHPAHDDDTAGTPGHNMAADLMVSVEVVNGAGEKRSEVVADATTAASHAEYAAWAATGDDSWAAVS